MEDRTRIQVRSRLDALRWLRARMCDHPGGFVTVSIAAVILGVSRQRVAALVKQGRFRSFQGPPGAVRVRVFVPIDDLINAPFVAEIGGRGDFGRKNTGWTKKF